VLDAANCIYSRPPEGAKYPSTDPGMRCVLPRSGRQDARAPRTKTIDLIAGRRASERASDDNNGNRQRSVTASLFARGARTCCHKLSVTAELSGSREFACIYATCPPTF